LPSLSKGNLQRGTIVKFIGAQIAFVTFFQGKRGQDLAEPSQSIITFEK